MTREEAIKKLEFLKINLPAAKSEISEIVELLKYPWISVEEDLPCNHKELMSVNDNNITKIVIVCYENNQIDFDYMRKICGQEWVWGSYYTPKYWFAIPEPPSD